MPTWETSNYTENHANSSRFSLRFADTRFPYRSLSCLPLHLFIEIAIYVIYYLTHTPGPWFSSLSSPLNVFLNNYYSDNSPISYNVANNFVSLFLQYFSILFSFTTSLKNYSLNQLFEINRYRFPSNDVYFKNQEC